MSKMFSSSQATNLDLSSFDTSKVTSIHNMFTYSQATELDLSSFNTSKVESMFQMFMNSQAKIGYAKTLADVTKFNRSPYKTDTLKFVVKQQ